ncbi:MAG: contact-dependent growth inhibition system immunity protein [Alphaproteobacteria bacterium]
MAAKQGNASIYQRGSKILSVPTALIGADQSEDGIWSGAGFIVLLEQGALMTAEAESNERLGEGLRRVLLRSEIVPPAPYPYDPAFDDKLAYAFGLKSKGRLYSGMRSCEVRWQRDEVLCKPLKRFRGGAFGAFPDNSGHDDVVVTFGASNTALGESLRQCLFRCL